MKQKKGWTNKRVFRDADRYEREQRARAADKPNNSEGNAFARGVLDPKNLPMKPPGKK